MTPRQTLRSYGVIGAGRLGHALAEALVHVGCPVTRVASRRTEDAEFLAARLPDAAVCEPAGVVACCDIVLMTVPDDALSGLASGLAWRSGQAAVHASGALGLEVLKPARAAGALAGCLHPLQSFPEREGGAARLSGIVCGVEGDGWLGDALFALCEAFGAEGVSLAGVDRARYHAAAVLASNYVVALHAAAAHVWRAAGLPVELARPALAPLSRGATDAIERLPLAQALTGPLGRGDIATLTAHLAALDGSPEAALYRALGRQLLTLPLDLPEAKLAELRELLADD